MREAETNGVISADKQNSPWTGPTAEMSAAGYCETEETGDQVSRGTPQDKSDKNTGRIQATLQRLHIGQGRAHERHMAIRSTATLLSK